MKEQIADAINVLGDFVEKETWNRLPNIVYIISMRYGRRMSWFCSAEVLFAAAMCWLMP